VNYRVFAKILVKILTLALILTLIPLLLLSQLGWEGLIPTIIYLQLLVIWVQAEIALRQHRLFSMQFEPFFDVDLRTTDAKGGKTLYLHNASKNPAYNIMLRMLDKEGKPIPPKEWENKVCQEPITDLAPEQGDILCYFNKDFYESICENKMAFAVDFFNQFGEDGSIYIGFSEGVPYVIPLPRKPQMPGILLNTFEDLSPL